MTDNAFIFNPNGVKLDEFDIIVQRQSKITTGVSAAHANFEITARDVKATARNLRYLNIVYITSNIAGVRDYCARIWPGTEGTRVDDGTLQFNLQAYESILATRYTAAQDIFEGTPGAIAIQLLSAARRQGYLPISSDTSSIKTSGASQKKEYNAVSIYESLNALATENGYIWYLLPSVDSATNILTLKMVWDFQKARIFPQRLSVEGKGAYLSITDMREVGELANHVQAYGKFDNWATPVFYEEKNAASISRYGQVATYVIHNNTETSSDGLIPIVQQYLAEHAFPQLQINAIVNSAPYPKLGDICTVDMPSNNGFIIDRRGNTATMQVTNLVYTPDQNSYVIHLEELQ